MKNMLKFIIFFSIFTFSLIKVAARNIYEKYNIGDEYSYKNIDFYVIGGNKEEDSELILLKSESLRSTEISKYGVEDGINYINKFVRDRLPGSFAIYDGFGYVAYYSSANCGYINNVMETSGCKEEKATNYDNSDVKHIVDNWAEDSFIDDDKFISARLITYEELKKILNCNTEEECNDKKKDEKYRWLNKNDENYWTMSQYQDEEFKIFEDASFVLGIRSFNVFGNMTGSSIKPVITIKKNIVKVIDDIVEEDNNKQDSRKEKNEIIEKVEVPNTYEQKILIIMLIGFIMLLVGILTVYRVSGAMKERK